MHRILLFLIFFSVVPRVRAGGVAIVWKGEVRVRGEVDGRDFTSATPPNAFALLRSRLGAEITLAEKVHVVLQLQDSRVFGEEMRGTLFSTVSNSRNVDLHQGYVKVEDLLAEGLTITLGRMELSYGNERLVGAVDWHNVGRSFDAGVIRYQWSVHSVDMFVANTGETTLPPRLVTPATVAATRDSGDLFSGIYYSLHTPEDFSLEIYAIHEWNRKQSVPTYDDLSRLTGGTRLKGSVSSILCEGEFAYQFGSRSSLDVRAFLLAGGFRYEFSENPVLSVGAAYEYLSGSPLGSVDIRSFDPVFHTGHKFYGLMDYFDSVPVQTNSRGLQDMHVNIVLRPSPGASVSIQGHNFLLARPWSGSRALGQEVDIVGVVNYSENVAFEAGAAGFLPGEVMRAWFNGRDVSWWGYVSTRVWF